MTILFLDAEFSPSNQPRLLSLALTCERGEFYACLAGGALKSALRGAQAFVLDTVVPQLESVPPGTPDAASASERELGDRLAAWLDSLGCASLQICFDYADDSSLFKQALRSAGQLERLSGLIHWVELPALDGEPECAEAMDASWANSERLHGISRHHALADARALHAAFDVAQARAAVSGNIPLLHDFSIDPDEWAQFEHVFEMEALRRRADADRFPQGTPICFLDIDDVVCLPVEFGGGEAIASLDRHDDKANAVFARLMHEPAVAVLKATHDSLDGRVRYVISSTWRRYVTRGQMLQILTRSGMAFVAQNLESDARWRTRHLPEHSRMLEITVWLDSHHEGEPFVVLDDWMSGSSMAQAASGHAGAFAGRVVLCDVDVGLRPEHQEAIVSALRRGATAPLFRHV